MGITSNSKYNPESLEEVFGTPKPSEASIRRWRSKWLLTGGRVQVTEYSAALKFLDESGIDPLFYQMTASTNDAANVYFYYIVFYKPEHEVYFKLHSNVA